MSKRTMNKKARRLLVWTAVEVGVLLLVHLGLQYWLSAANIASVMLSAGSHTPAWMLGVTGLFLLVRLLVMLCVPAMVLRTAVVVGMEWWWGEAVAPRPSVGGSGGDAARSGEK